MPMLDGHLAGRVLEQVTQRRDGHLGLAQLVLEPPQMLGDESVAALEVGCVEHGTDAVDRHVEVPKAADHLRGRDLVDGVAPVARVRVHLDWLQQTCLVVVGATSAE
jgi:hypothetical protein